MAPLSNQMPLTLSREGNKKTAVNQLLYNIIASFIFMSVLTSFGALYKCSLQTRSHTRTFVRTHTDTLTQVWI